MRFDYLRYALNNLSNRRLRSWLTIISILIGITMVFTLVSFGQGLSVYVDSLSEEMGSDKLIAQAGNFQTSTGGEFYFTEEEVDLIEKVRGIEETTAYQYGGIEIKEDDVKKYVYGVGVQTGDAQKLMDEVFGVEVVKGRALKEGDKQKVLLGYNYQLPDKIFEDPIDLGKKIHVNDVKFEVVGFYGEVGNPQDDSNVYITQDGWELLYPGESKRYVNIIARTAPGEEPKEVAERAEKELRDFRDQEEGEEDFFIQTFEDAIETFTNVIGVINSILILIALISVVVAGVNIMNTMYTAVVERTKEIGVMKAIGATNNSILLIFVVESGMLGLVGSGIGVILGYTISNAGGSIAASAGYSMLQPVFPIELVAGCLLFGFILGAGSGLLPARAASRQKPVNALRYE